MAESPKMLMEKEGPLGWITFNQPEKRNAVSQEMWQMIPDIVKDLEEDEESRVIVLRGAGDQAFVGGVAHWESRGAALIPRISNTPRWQVRFLPPPPALPSAPSSPRHDNAPGDWRQPSAGAFI